MIDQKRRVGQKNENKNVFFNNVEAIIEKCRQRQAKKQ